jgi:uncharacterized protein (UPF0303 family)
LNTDITELIEVKLYYTVMAEKATEHNAESIRRNVAPMMKFQQSSRACMYLHTEV